MATTEELDTILSQMRGRRDADGARKLLMYLRRTLLPRSDLVLLHGPQLLTGSTLSDAERLDVLEQLLLAALDCGDSERAKMYLEELLSRFPESSRVRQLHAVCCESVDGFEDATALYDALLQLDKTNVFAMKRKVAILRAQGKLSEAIAAAHSLAKVLQADVELWKELASMYEQSGDMENAVFCMEEVVLATPLESMAHLRLGELLYAVGDMASLRTARQHFAQALELQPLQNLRALLGLTMSCNAVACGKGGSKGEDGETNRQLHQLATRKALALYEEKHAPEELLSMVKRLVTEQDGSFARGKGGEAEGGK